MKSIFAILACVQVAVAANEAQAEKAVKVMNDFILAGSPEAPNMRLKSKALFAERKNSGQVFNEKMIPMGSTGISLRPDVRRVSKASKKHVHQVVFAIKQKNMDLIEKSLLDVSTPGSKNYGKHWTREQIAEVTANRESGSHVIKYLTGRGVHIDSTTINMEYITASAPVALWESIFEAKFNAYAIGDSHREFVRAESFAMSEYLVGHVSYVYNIVDFPEQRPVLISQSSVGAISTIPGKVTPALLNSYYWISSNDGGGFGSQAVYESINQTYSPSDLTIFQQTFGLPEETVAVDIGGHSDNNACVPDGGNNCGEANLDVQYIMAVAQNVPTTYYYDDDWMLSFVKSVADMTDPPNVISISYGSSEPQNASYTQSFDNEAMKLGMTMTNSFLLCEA
jgi:hypothetical protein